MKGTPVKIVCACCGSQFERAAGAVNAAKKRGAALYCSKACFHRGRYRRTPQERAAYMAAYREANRQKARKYAREYRVGEHRNKALRSQRESYQRNREECLRRSKEYAQRHRNDIRARVKQWFRDNPDKADLHSVKGNLSVSLGVRIAELPLDLVEAKVAQIRIMRWVRAEMAKRDQTDNKKED